MKKILLVYALLVGAGISQDIFAADAVTVERHEKACSICGNNNSCCPSRNSLTLCDLCSDRIKTRCLSVDESIDAMRVCADTIVAQELCVPRMSLQDLCSNNVRTNNLCAEVGNINELCAQVGLFNLICTTTINAQSICVSGDVRSCSTLTAQAALSRNTTYTLGTPVPFDLILSDPSSRIQFSPTRYVTDVAGIYAVTTQIVLNNLQGPGLIVGTPVGLIEVYVNGTLLRQDFAPYLSFANRQSSNLTTMIALQKGDELTFAYKVIVVDENLGLIEYPGFVNLIGSPLDIFRTFFTVHYLSSDCNQAPCSPCDLSICQPCVVSCDQCQPSLCTTCCPD